MAFDIHLSDSQQRLVALALAALVLLGVALLLNDFVSAAVAHHGRVAQLDRERSAYARLVETEPRWAAEIARIRKATAGADPVFAASTVDAGARMVGERIASMLSAQGLSDAHPKVQIHVTGEDGITEVTSEIAFKTDIEKLTRVLFTFREARPFVIARRLSIHVLPTPPNTTTPAPTALEVEVDLTSYMRTTA